MDIAMDTINSSIDAALRKHSNEEARECYLSLKKVVIAYQMSMSVSPSLMKELDSLITLTKTIQTMDIWTAEFGVVIARSIRQAASVPKFNKKLIQVLCILEKKLDITEAVYEREFAANIRKDMESPEMLYVWCSLMDVSVVIRDVLWNHCTAILAQLNHQLGHLFSVKAQTVHHQEHAHALLKTVLQLCQHSQQRFQKYVWSDSEHLDLAVMGNLSLLFSYLHHALTEKTLPKDCVLLAGTAACFLITSSSDKEKSASAFTALTDKLGHASNISIGNLSSSITESCQSGLTFGHLALVNGMLSCASIDLLLQPITPGSSSPLLLYIFGLTSELCYITEFQYHSFKLLNQWFQRAVKCYKELVRQQSGVFLLSGGSQVLDKTLRIIWTHLDSPIDGVNESVIEIFKLLLELQSLENEQAKDHPEISPVGIPEYLLPKVGVMSWQVKGKHILLAALIPYCDVCEVLEKDNRLLKSLLDCLATNYLAPASTNLYKAILKKFECSPNREELWKMHCKELVLRALTHDTSLLRHNFGHYWLPWNFKILPETLPLILEGLDSGNTRGDNYLHAVVSVLKTARSQQILNHFPIERISQTLACQDDGIRMDAFTLLCVTPKTGEPLNAAEIELLHQFLPLNMNMDSPPCRQLLGANIRSAFVRVRDSALSLLRPKSKHRPAKETIQDKITSSIEFVQWFYELCLKHINPGSCYQRLKTSLDWLTVLFEVFIYVPGNSARRKGVCPETVSALHEFAREIGVWEFFSPKCTSCLLGCLLSGTDDIREAASSILLLFFPWPLKFVIKEEGEEKIDKRGSDMVSLLLKGLGLCNDPRARECESGAVITRVVFERLICLDKLQLSIERKENKFVCSSLLAAESSEEAALHFVSSIVIWLLQDVNEAEKNVLFAAKYYPAHGFISALQRCLNEIKLPIKLTEKWKTTMVDLKKLLTKLTNLVLDVFGGKVHEQESAPSFEQMSIGIQQTIQESENMDVSDRDETILSADHQMVNTWCWLNIRESSVLMGRLGKYFANSTGSFDVLGVSDFDDIAQLFMKILTKCRHRGAIEGCNVGFIDFCSWLLAHPESSLQSIPGKLLEQVLDQISESSAASVTRRSAGLPLIVQSILASESKIRQSVLLERAVSHLMQIVSRPTPEDSDQKFDLPQVHALNILKAVFRESSIAQSLMTSVPEAAIHAITGFASPDWAVRNASTQLFGTLISRMLGQKRNRDDTLNPTTAPDFFTLYPSLYPFIMTNLKGMNNAGSFNLHPCTFPILSILARLSPGIATDETERMVNEMQGPVYNLASSPLYSVRELSARALVALIPINSTEQFLASLVDALPKENVNVRQNVLHGRLLQIENIIKGNSSRVNGNRPDSILSSEALKWASCDANPCVSTRTVALRIVHLAESSGFEVPFALSDSLSSEFSRMSKTKVSNANHGEIQVGLPLFTSELTKRYLEKSSSPASECIRRCLESGDQDIMTSCIKWIADSATNKTVSTSEFQSIQDTLVERLLIGNLPWEVTCNIQSLIIDIYLAHRIFCNKNPSLLLEKVLNTIAIEINCKQAAYGVSIAAIILYEFESGYIPDRHGELPELMLRCSMPQNSELMRYHCAEALCISGCRMMQTKTNQRSILTAAVNLLMDEQQQVRCKAADFILKLKASDTGSHNHPNQAIEILFHSSFARSGIVTEADYISWVFSLVETKEFDQVDIIRKEIENICKEMFESQEINPFWESCIVDSRALKVIEDLLGDNKDLGECISTGSLVPSICDQLEQIYTVLSEYCSDGNYLNATFTKKTFETLHHFIILSKVLLLLPVSGNRLLDAYSKLRTIIGMHPQLLAVL